MTLQLGVILGTRDGGGVWTGVQEMGGGGQIVSIFRRGEEWAKGQEILNFKGNYDFC